MRTLAGRLGMSAMTLYTYVPGKAELLDLMLDALWRGTPR
jgi:AcrR family transcriptional regulator